MSRKKRAWMLAFAAAAAAAISAGGLGSVIGKVEGGRGTIPMVLIQAAAPTGSSSSADATSAATKSGEAGGSVDAVSSASTEETAKDAAYCLKCHGPFEKLAERTAAYITEWDEKANPHVFVPHESAIVVQCEECHDPHPIPYAKQPGGREPKVTYCYSCHHAETLANCNQCHKE